MNTDKIYAEHIANEYAHKQTSKVKALKKLEPNNAQSEYYLTDVVRIMNEEGLKTGAFIVEDNTEILGVNDKIQLDFEYSGDY